MGKKPKKPNLFTRIGLQASKIVNRGNNKVLHEYLEKNTMVAVIPPFGVAMKEKKGAPILGEYSENQDKLDEYYESPEIQKLQAIMTDRSPQNIRWAFNHDNSCLTASFMLSQAVNGSVGLTVKSKNERLKKVLDKYHKRINTVKIMDKAVKDNLCFTESVWWKHYNKEEQIIEPKWVDYITLTRITNKHTSSVKWIQATYVDSNLPEKDNAKWKSYEPYIDYFKMFPRMPTEPKDRLVKRHIFQEDVLNFNFFSAPPILGILDTILWKKWMQYDAKLGGQKYATPLMDIEYELPSGYVITDQETADLSMQMAQDLNEMMNFGVLAHPVGVKLNPIQQQGQVFNFVQYLEYADKQIHKAILVPANLLDSSGSELATSRTTKDMFIITLNALRHKFLKEFEKLDYEYLEYIGFKVKEGEFELLFSEEDNQQQFTQNEEFTALMQMHDRGITKDVNEVRGYVAKFGMTMPQLSKKEMVVKEAEELENIYGPIDDPAEDENIDNEIEGDIKKELGEA